MDAGPRHRQSQQQDGPPPIALLLARPLLLTICAVLGGIIGLTVWDGGKGYEATALVEFTTSSQDVAVVRLEAQTLAEKMLTEPVIARAAAALGDSWAELAAATTAKRFDESYLISVTATAARPGAAIARANAVAQAGIDQLRESVLWRVGTATADGNALLHSEGLLDPDADAARRAQVGSAIGGRQEGLKGQSESWSVARYAADAKTAGVTKPLCIAVGAVVGLCVGCLTALLLGTRRLRSRSLGAIRRLAPDVEVLTSAQAPQLAGQLVEAGERYLAVVVAPGAEAAGERFTANMERILGLHGKTVTTVHAPAVPDEYSAVFVRADAVTKVSSLVGSDVLMLTVEAGTESAALLEGRSGFRAVVVMRRGRTPMSVGLAAARAYRNAAPVLVQAK